MKNKKTKLQLIVFSNSVCCQILQPHLNPMVRCFGPVLYFFYCLSWHLLMSCNKTNTDRWFVQYELYMTSKKFILPSASPQAIWIFPRSYRIHIALTTGPYLYNIVSTDQNRSLSVLQKIWMSFFFRPWFAEDRTSPNQWIQSPVAKRRWPWMQKSPK